MTGASWYLANVTIECTRRTPLTSPEQDSTAFSALFNAAKMSWLSS